MGRMATCTLLAVMIWGLVRCAPPPVSEGGFESRDPGAKLYAIQHAGEQRDRSKIPQLIEQLDSDDGAVRMYAIIALEKITGTRMGYSPYDSAWKRAPAVDAWVAAYKNGEFSDAGGGDAPARDAPKNDGGSQP